MISRRDLLVGLMASAPVTCFAVEHEAVMARLMRVDVFAFGGVGFAMAISDGEKDYRTILSGNSAAADFERIYAGGTAPGRAYALVGLREKKRKRFDELASSLAASGVPVLTMRGCGEAELPFSELVKRIRAGMYSGPMTRNLIPATE